MMFIVVLLIDGRLEGYIIVFVKIHYFCYFDQSESEVVFAVSAHL